MDGRNITYDAECGIREMLERSEFSVLRQCRIDGQSERLVMVGNKM